MKANHCKGIMEGNAQQARYHSFTNAAYDTFAAYRRSHVSRAYFQRMVGMFGLERWRHGALLSNADGIRLGFERWQAAIDTFLFHVRKANVWIERITVHVEPYPLEALPYEAFALCGYVVDLVPRSPKERHFLQNGIANTEITGGFNPLLISGAEYMERLERVYFPFEGLNVFPLVGYFNSERGVPSFDELHSFNAPVLFEFSTVINPASKPEDLALFQDTVTEFYNPYAKEKLAAYLGMRVPADVIKQFFSLP